MLIIPAIDLKDGCCVRLKQGLKSEVTVYDEDPLRLAQRLEAAGAQFIHVVDLDGAFAGAESPNRHLACRIFRTVNIPVQFGGGIRSVSDVRQLIDAGAARVVLGTLAAESSEDLHKILEAFGPRICAGIDARDGQVMVRGWEEQAGVSALELARRMADLGVKRIVYTDVTRDGMLTGSNVEQITAIARAAKLKVTASGGISSLDDIRQLINANEPLLDSVIIGKALY